MTSPTAPGYLGYQPTIQPLVLTTGASFMLTVQPSGGATFPAQTVVEIVLTAPGTGAALGTWQGTVNSALTQVSWTVANAICDPIPANSRYTMLVTYPTSPTTTFAWFEGTVIRT